MNEVEAIRLQENFATGVRGLYNYGAKVIEPGTLYKTEVTVANVPV